jgi:CRISPR-associated protein Csm3
VPAQTDFALRLDAENLTGRDLGLLCIGLQEFRAGTISVGGSSTRGLGQCRLYLKRIYTADLSNREALVRYLTTSENSERMTSYNTPEAIDAFLREHIQALFNIV